MYARGSRLAYAAFTFNPTSPDHHPGRARERGRNGQRHSRSGDDASAAEPNLSAGNFPDPENNVPMKGSVPDE